MKFWHIQVTKGNHQTRAEMRGVDWSGFLTNSTGQHRHTGTQVVFASVHPTEAGGSLPASLEQKALGMSDRVLCALSTGILPLKTSNTKHNKWSFPYIFSITSSKVALNETILSSLTNISVFTLFSQHNDWQYYVVEHSKPFWGNPKIIDHGKYDKTIYWRKL